MRTLLSAFLATTAFPVWADTFHLDTNVTNALITGQGGVITYSADTTLQPGKHTLIARVPYNGYDLGLLDTHFGGNAGIRIISQTHATDYANPLRNEPTRDLKSAQIALDTASAAYRAYEETIEAKQAEKSAAELQLQLMRVTAATGLGNSDAGLQADELAAVAAILAKTTQQAQQTIARTKTELAAMEPKRSDLRADLHYAERVVASLKPSEMIDSVEVTTQIEVASAQNVTIHFDNLENAYWTPIYNGDLSQDKTTGILNLHRSAQVQIGTIGVKPLDPWENVTITLSTANLADRTNTNIPYPQLKRLVDEIKLRKSRVSGAAYDSDAARAPEPVVEMVEESPRGASFSGQTVLFNLGAGHSVDWRSGNNTFAIDTLSVPVDLYAMANAAQDHNAFLYTDLKNETGGILLAGNIILTRDGTPVGSTRLPQLSPGQQEPIGLGPLYGIRLQRDTIGVQEGDSGFIAAKSEINRSFRTAVTSSLDYDIPFKLLDVIPTSEDEDLVIRMEARPRPTEENRDGKRGVLVWDIDLGAGKTDMVSFGYQMKWPAEKTPVGR